MRENRKKMIESMYDRLIELRNRISLDGTDEIFEEDHLLLDEVLDYIEKKEIEKQQRVQEDDYNATVDIYKELEMGIKFKKQEKLLELYKRLTIIYRQYYNGYLIPREQIERQELEKKIRKLEE